MLTGCHAIRQNRRSCICDGVAALEAAGNTDDSWQESACFEDAVVNVHCVYDSDSESESSDTASLPHSSLGPTVEVNAFAFTKAGS